MIAFAGDAITSVAYVNGYFAAPTTITTASLPTVVVSIDGTTGLIDTVAAAVETKPNVTSNGLVTYTGHFSSVYRGGRNVAPNGASKLQFDPASGKLVGLH